MSARWDLTIFCLRLMLHMAPGYIATIPHRLMGRKVTIQADVSVPLYHGGTQRLHGTFHELAAEAKALAFRKAPEDRRRGRRYL